MKTRAAGFALLAALGASAAALPASPARAQEKQAAGISEEARRHFRAGVAYLQDPDGARYEEAYIEFRAAYAASSSPKVLGNVGLCAMKLERDGEAIDAYRRYLAEVPDIDAEERAQIQTDLTTLETSAARLTLIVEPDGAKVVDTRLPVQKARVTNVYGPVKGGRVELGIRPGHHEVRVELAGHQESSFELDLTPGARETRTIKLAPREAAVRPAVAAEAPAARGSNTIPWIITGVGGAALAAGAVTGIVALSKAGGISGQCPANECPPGYDLAGERSSAKTFVTATDVLLIGGGALVATGATWLLLAPSRAPKESRLNGAALCTGDGCAGSVRLTF